MRSTAFVTFVQRMCLVGVVTCLALPTFAAEPKPETAGPQWYKNIGPTPLNAGAVTLAPSTQTDKSSGLTFHYPPYVAGSFVEGNHVTFVPWETLKPYLTPEGAKIFGGARPKGDDDGQR